MKITKDLQDYLEENISDGVYHKLMDKNWSKIEAFREEMEARIHSEAKLYAKLFAEELMVTFKKMTKDSKNDTSKVKTKRKVVK